MVVARRAFALSFSPSFSSLLSLALSPALSRSLTRTLALALVPVYTVSPFYFIFILFSFALASPLMFFSVAHEEKRARRR